MSRNGADDAPPHLAALLGRLTQVKRAGAGYTALCPAHDDSTASLSVSVGSESKILIKCHAGCPAVMVLGALGLQLSDLYLPRDSGATNGHHREDGPASVQPAQGVKERPRLVSTYDYIDRDGNLRYQTCRFLPKTFRQRRPNGDGGWVYNLDGITPILYRLPEVIAAGAARRPVVICEGEKDADALVALGYVATTSPMGAGKWRDEYAEMLTGVEVMLLPDNDAVGRAHMETVAGSLIAHGAFPHLIDLAGLPPKGDVSDWLAAGGTAEQLDALILASPRWVSGGPPFPVVWLLEGDAPAPPAVLVDRLIIDQDITLWAGHGGSGKSTAALLVAVSVALGRSVVGSLLVRRPGPVLLILPEDGHAAARMMLDAIIAGLDMSPADRTYVARRIALVPDETLVLITHDAAQIGRTARSMGAVLAILDPLSALLGGGDENDNAIAAAACDALRREVCRGAGCAVLIQHHNRKPGKDAGPDLAPSVHDMRGGGGWANGARLVIGVAKRGTRITMTGLKGNRVSASSPLELDLSIDATPDNAALWTSCTLTDANAGASAGLSESYTPGRGRPLNANERAALDCLDDQHEAGKRSSYSAWASSSGLPRNTFDRVRGRLLTARLVSAIPTGRKTRGGAPEYVYAITADGTVALDGKTV